MDVSRFNTEEREWIENVNGNFCCIEDDALTATVFRNRYKVWLIILNRNLYGYLVEDEAFDRPESAIHRTIDILDGAKCNLKKLLPRTG